MRKFVTLFLILICVSNVAACSASSKTFEIMGAQKLIVQSGTTGKRIDITNTEDIKYITDNINVIEFSKGKKVKSDGWSYRLQWQNEDEEIIENLTLYGDGYTINYDGYYYKGMSADYEIDLEFIESLFAK